jgi:hypothetical protein
MDWTKEFDLDTKLVMLDRLTQYLSMIDFPKSSGMKLKPKSGYFVSAAIACLALSQQVNAADEATAKTPSPLDLAKQLSPDRQSDQLADQA